MKSFLLTREASQFISYELTTIIGLCPTHSVYMGPNFLAHSVILNTGDASLRSPLKSIQ